MRWAVDLILTKKLWMLLWCTHSYQGRTFNPLIAADVLAALEGGQLHRLDLAAGVPRVEVIHHIFKNDQHLVVLAERVNPVIQSDETAAEGRKHKVRVLARLDVISTEAR